MIPQHVSVRQWLLALAVAHAALAFTGCPGTALIAPGGTFSVDYSAGGDISQMQVVVVFDEDDQLDVGSEYTYTFSVAKYDDGSGNVYETRSFVCPGVPVGSCFVRAVLDYDGDGVYESPWPDYEVSWIYGEPNYSIDTSGTPYVIEASYDPPVPNYTVTETWAAPLEFGLSFGGA